MSKRGVHHTHKFFRFIILHLSVNVHRCLTIFMSGKVLDCLGNNANIQKVGNIGMPKLMWRHIEVDGINQFWIVLLMAAEGWGNGVLNALAVDILIIVAWLGSPHSHILPNPLKLRITKLG